MWHAVPVGAGLGSECREKWLCTWGGYVLDQVGCSWRCWRHPDACGVGVKVADHHSRRAPWEALGDFIQGGSGRVAPMRYTVAWVFEMNRLFVFSNEGSTCTYEKKLYTWQTSPSARSVAAFQHDARAWRERGTEMSEMPGRSPRFMPARSSQARNAPRWVCGDAGGGRSLTLPRRVPTSAVDP